MLKSKLQFFVSFFSFALLITTLVVSLQEAEYYVGAEDLWKQTSWSFWSK
ncbi:MAG: hypothetical protein NE327_05255 [Lentisphaeraceae bacterium]|nr:hypothetical protein [Lentisphaeraceae bacterium]